MTSSPTPRPHRASIESLPSEIIAQILLLLPVSPALGQIALASRSFGSWILWDASFAALHLKTWMAWNRIEIGTIGKLLDTLYIDWMHSTRSPWARKILIWNMLPFTYRATVFKWILSSALPNCDIPIGDDYEDSIYYYLGCSKSLALRLVEQLCADKNFDIQSQNNRVLIWCCFFGYAEAVEVLSEKPGVRLADNGEAIQMAVLQNNADTLQILLRAQFVINPESLIDALKQSTPSCLSMVEAFLDDGRVDCSYNRNEAIVLASSQGKLDIVRRLLEDERVNPADNDCLCLIEAASGKYWEVVKLLLKHPKVDPSVDDNHTLFTACNNGEFEIVQTLLLDSRVTMISGAVNNRAFTAAIKYAIRKKDPWVALLLLTHPSVDPSGDDNIALFLACESDNMDIVSPLLSNKQVKRAISAKNNRAFVAACVTGNIEMIDAFLEIEEFDPTVGLDEAVIDALSCDKNEAIMHICRNTKIRKNFSDDSLDTVLRLFLWKKDDKMVHEILETRPQLYLSGYTFEIACRKGRKDLLKLFLQQVDNQSSVDDDLLFDLGAEFKFEIIELLMQHSCSVVSTYQIQKSFNWACEIGSWKLASLHLLHHRIHLPSNINPMVFGGMSKTVGDFLRQKVHEAAWNDDVLTVESILAHPLWDSKHDDVLDEIIYPLTRIKLETRDLILSILKHRRFTCARNVKAKSFHAYCVAIAAAVLFPSIAPNPTRNNNELLLWAVSEGLDVFVELLLEDQRFGEMSRNNYINLRLAAFSCGQIGFKALFRFHHTWSRKHHIIAVSPDEAEAFALGDLEEIDFPTGQKMLCHAIKMNWIIVVKTLISCFNVDPSHLRNHALAEACERDHCEIVRILLDEHTVDPTTRSYYAMRKSVEHGCAECVYRFLDCLVDASFDNNVFLCTAARLGHVDVVDVLIQSDMLNGIESEYRVALQNAVNGGHANCVSQLKWLLRC
ncbi:hypothetical protein BCR33DRAFT_791476 [Rhizoclosmatium globosum]|uniref:Uncharacterized protein n=1 Tax=Rhizoclosmatium globosum TaxID=329046 RepID=A0A1Y2BFB5_9FUNG|nr:hypothetical protein BCR33DRAFT_791476 [Rhizoclosmatium globosum]|eukprot:ORY33250.1 hypothetical protein BCR33DRAFT_791476 [Rhizoclosmatium globosum]